MTAKLHTFDALLPCEVFVSETVVNLSTVIIVVNKYCLTPTAIKACGVIRTHQGDR